MFSQDVLIYVDTTSENNSSSLKNLCCLAMNASTVFLNSSLLIPSSTDFTLLVRITFKHPTVADRINSFLGFSS
uniref:Putative ovule protein n=1 Tax=Solanum chacoense TaxID=4108 RepID=A0A0V0H1M9_SOLCH